MNRRVLVAYRLRWILLLGWGIVMVLWTGMLGLAITRPGNWAQESIPFFRQISSTPLANQRLWGTYVLMLGITPWLWLKPRRHWYRQLNQITSLPRLPLIVASLAAALLNMIFLQCVMALTILLIHDKETGIALLRPWSLMEYLSGTGLLAYLWGMIFACWLDHGKLFGRYYRLVAALLLGGMGLWICILPLSQYLTYRIIPNHPLSLDIAFGISRFILASVLIWAIGSSVQLLFALMRFYCYHEHLCLHCHYDLRASPVQSETDQSYCHCPECGQKTEIATSDPPTV